MKVSVTVAEHDAVESLVVGKTRDFLKGETKPVHAHCALKITDRASDAEMGLHGQLRGSARPNA